MTADAAGPVTAIVGLERASDLSDALVDITVSDPSGRLGRRPVLRLHRRDRTPAVLERPVLLDRHGRGRFLGWTPEELCAIDVLPEAGAGGEGPEPRFRVVRRSVLAGALIAAFRRPGGLLRVARLALAGNRRGAEFRFVRLFDAITAPTWKVWSKLAFADDVADAADLDLAGAPRLFCCIEPGSPADRAATRADLIAQNGPKILWSEPGERPDPAVVAPGDLFLRLPAGARTTPGALRHLVAPFLDDDPPSVVWCDEDRIDGRGRRNDPFFKPTWDATAVGEGFVPVDGAVLRLCALPPDLDPTTAPLRDLVTAAVGGRRDAVVHVPRILIHLPGRRAKPEPVPFSPPSDRVLVSVVIPTRDRADLLRACVDGLRRRTTGVDLEIVVVDNDSVEATTLALFESLRSDPRIRILHAPGRFNFSALVGRGVAATRSERLLLLNNDVEPIEPHWLQAMVAELERPEVGVVGARLLFPDGHVQHGGVVLGAGTVARHAFHFLRLDDGEDRGTLSVRREMSAVTAACLLTRRSLWNAVGGMDDVGLPVAFNDVDYCLKVRSLGRTVVFTPQATLIHRESVSRGNDDTPEKKRRFAGEEALMIERWGEMIAADPYGNPNLSKTGEAFVLTLGSAPSPRRSQ